jgi:hypothetical protein
MIQSVTDARSNKNDQIKHAVEVIGRSADRLKVFKAIYKGSKAFKTPADLVKLTRLDRIRVTQEAAKLVGNGIVHAEKVGKELRYRKDVFYSTNRSRILQLVANPSKLKKLPTKTQPRSAGGRVVVIKGLDRKPKTKEIHIDEIDSFSAVKKAPKGTQKKSRISETKFKQGVQKILGQKGVFKDWGGEKNDLMTSRLRYKGTRLPTAFAFKGPGKRGTLTPKKMGKHGDQIQRLFESAATLFVLQYWSDIGERVREQVVGWAELTSMRFQKKILFCLIDGDDTGRLIQAYRTYFS